MSQTDSKLPVIALAGNPNVGKSTLFNWLTGMNQHTGNWPGKTVDLAQGRVTWKKQQFLLVDLPGTYSLRCRSKEEEVAQSFIASREADCVLVICDGTALERNLILAQQVLELHEKVIICINLIDEARRKNITIDTNCISKQMGVPVLAISAGQKVGLAQLQKTVLGVLSGGLPCAPNRLRDGATSKDLIERAESICARATHRQYSACEARHRRLDRILTGKYLGFPIMLCLLFLVIWLTVLGANYPSELLARVFHRVYLSMRQLLHNWNVPVSISGFLLDGLYTTICRVISVMLPPMAIFFPLFTLLEDAGYLPRAAFLMDKSLSRCGACGKQALTMCMGLGCNAAGVTGCRIIDSPRERLIAILTNSFMPCNGRFSSLILLGTIFFGSIGSSFFAALLITTLIALGAAVTMSASWILSKTVLKGESSALVLEMPPYRKPRIGQILVRSFIDRTLFVASRAILVALPAGALLWCCGNLSCNGDSLMSHLGAFFDPVGRLLGMNGTILLSFILAIPANELTMPILLMSLTGTGMLTGEMSATEIGTILTSNGWSWQTALCTMVFILFHWPCGTTLLTISKEAGNKKWAVLAFLLPTAFGTVLCLLLNTLFRLI